MATYLITRIAGMALRSPVLLCLALAAGGTGWGQDSEPARETLRGFDRVYVEVDIQPEVQRAGFTGSQLTTDIELKLRLAGIEVGDISKDFVSGAWAGTPFLRVNVRLLDGSGGAYAYGLRLSLRQSVTLSGNGQPAYASTWSVAGVGITSADKLHLVREGVEDLVGEFVNAYLSVNPRRPSAEPLRSAIEGRQSRDSHLN